MVSIGITIVCLLNSSEALKELIDTPYNSYRDIVTIFNYLVHYDQFRSVMIAIASLAYSFSYCHDKNNHCMEILLYRGTLKSYALSKIIANAVAVLLSFLLGVFIYFLILHIWFPILDESTINSTGGVFGIYGDFIENGKPYLILIFESLLMGIGIMALTTFGLLISTYITNKYVTISAGFIFYFLLCSITMYFPDALYYPAYINGVRLFPFGFALNYTIKVMVQILLFFTFGYMFYQSLNKRWAK